MSESANIVIVCHRVAIPTESPDRFLITPWGEVQSKSGPYTFDEQAAAAIVKEFEAQGVDVVIDRDHQTVRDEPSAPDGSRPGVGWIKRLEVVNGEGLYAADVEWTEHGAQLVATKAYRYISPAFLHEKGSRRPNRLHSVAIVTRPAITGMRPVVNMDNPMGDEPMDEYQTLMTQLRQKLKLGDDADSERILATIGAHQEQAEQGISLHSAVCQAAGLETTTTHAEVLTAAGKLTEEKAANPDSDVTPDPARYVSMKTHSELSQQLADTKRQIREIKSDAFLAKGREQGRIATHSEQQWRAKYIKDPEGAEQDLLLVPEGTFPRPGRVTSHAEPGTTAGGTGGGRSSVIAQAKDEFKAGQSGMPCTEQEYVNQCLSEHGEAVLSDEEVKTHSVRAE